MDEDGCDLLNNTWNRAMHPIHKIGFMDGATDGQAAVFQSSFDMGYTQGLNFGIELGFARGISTASKSSKPQILTELQSINCQICTHHKTLKENIGNLYNDQQEKNMLLLKKCVNNK